MKEKKILMLLLFIVVSSITIAQKTEKEDIPYKNPSISIDERVNDLLGRMSLEEKLGQLLCFQGWEMYSKTSEGVTYSEKLKEALDKHSVGMFWATLRADPWTKKTLKNGLDPYLAAKTTNAIQKYAVENTRLGIPILFAEEGAHGHMAIGTTVFPTSLGQASTWNPALIQEMATIIGEETRLQGAHIGYGPILDLAREPRWSRMEETYGEDPFLITEMGKAMVKGFQGEDISSGKNIVSTLKHFIAYGIPEGGHNSGSVSIDPRDLFQNHLPPFKASVETGALSIMTSYNSVNGIPCTSNAELLKGLVREDWGFDGFYVSDLGAIGGLMGSHRVASSPIEASSLALNAGVDVDLGGRGFQALPNAMEKGLTTTKIIDQAVRRVLEIKFKMGLFENPYVDAEEAANKIRSTKHIELARKVAQQSVVLLKNENSILPLKKEIGSIAVIGPNADNMYNQLGDYTAPQDENNIVTVLEGISNKIGQDTKITYVKGCAIRDTTVTNIDEAVQAARNAEVAIVVLGGSSARDFKTEYQNTGAALISNNEKESILSDMECGEGFDRSSLVVMGKQLELLNRLINTGTPVVVILIEGRPLNLAGAEDKVSALMTAWYPGQEGGNAIADILFGDYNPSGRLPVSIPKSVGQLPVYYNNISPRRHNYVEGDSNPLYSFGHGLSYTKFEYSNLKIEPTEVSNSINVEITFDLKNVGQVEGDEVTQLYLRDIIGSVVTPEKQLKGFQRIHLKAGEEKNIRFKLSSEELSLFNQKMQKVVEPGYFSVMVGASSNDIKLTDNFEVKTKIDLKN